MIKRKGRKVWKIHVYSVGTLKAQKIQSSVDVIMDPKIMMAFCPQSLVTCTCGDGTRKDSWD